MGNADINLTPTAGLVEIGTITGRTWGLASETYAGVLLVHGLGAHSGWFEALGRRLKVRQVFSLAYDQVGFGKRNTEVFSSSKQWLRDLVKATAYLKNLLGDKPIFIIGNSMGGLVALKVLPLLPPGEIAGVAMLAPAFEGHATTFPLAYKLQMLFKTYVNPEQEFMLPYRMEAITEDESVRVWMEKDVEKRFKVPGRMILSLLALTQSLRFSNLTSTCPVLMLTAGRDILVDNKVNQSVFDKIVSPYKKQRVFSNALHDLSVDPSVDEVADEIVAWIHHVIEMNEKKKVEEAGKKSTTSKSTARVSF